MPAGYQGLNGTFAQRLRALLDAAPGPGTIASGFRTRDQQAALYAKNPKLAAKPGHSNHERGLAADLSFADARTKAWVHANAARFGLFFPMSWEPWHIEPIGARSASGEHSDFDPDAYTIQPTDDDHREAQGSLLGRLFGMILPNVPQASRQSAGAGRGQAGATTAISGGIEGAAQAAYAAGFRGEALVTMVAIAGAESGFDSQAHNPNAGTGDNSYGLWQINMLGNLGPERRRQFGISSDDELFDPSVNARAAYLVSGGGGKFSPWSVYKSGAYRKYLAQAREAVRTLIGASQRAV